MENRKVMAIKVNIGLPQMNINRLPVYVPRNHRYSGEKCKLIFNISNKELLGTFLSVGNPHTVIQVNDVKDFLVTKYGRIVENYKYFPQRTNVEFVQIIDEQNIKVRVWERGVGETLGCGTGAVAASYVLYKENKLKNRVNVELEGGKLVTEIDEQKNTVFLEGSAVTVYEGEIEI